MSIDTSFDLQPTHTDPTGDEQNIDAPPSTDTTPATKAAPQVEHTDGGLPAIPLLIITSNTAAAGLSAAAIAAGPLAAAGIAAGTLVTAVAVSARSRNRTKTAARRAAPKPPAKKTPASGGGGKVPAARRTGGSAGSNTGSRTGGLGGAKKTAPIKPSAGKASGSKATAPKASSGKTSAAGAGANRKRTNTGGTGATGGKGSRIGQIKALRNAKKAEGKTRKQQREQATQTRRALKDGRRGEKAALKNLKKQNGTPGAPGTKSPAGTTRKAGKAGIGAALKKFASKQAAGARTKARNSKDQAVLSRGQRIKQARRNAKSRATMARKILGAKTRYGTKAAGAALLTAPAGLLGALTTPLGRKLGWQWLMHPGRRLYQRLTATAKKNLHARIAEAKNTHARNTSPKTSDSTPAELIAAAVPRGPRRHTITMGEPAMTDALQFHFDESAADMEAAAAAYEPGGMIHVYQTIQGMPAGIQSWANTFKILAEKSDESFPLDAEVGEGLSEVFELLQKAASAAEDVQKTFATKHEHDLERLQSPRKSLEAEKGWDIAANEDLL